MTHNVYAQAFDDDDRTIARVTVPIKILYLEDLDMAHVQRTTNLRRARDMAIDYNPHLFRPLTVATCSEDGNTYLVDGGHRKVMLSLKGFKAAECYLYENLTFKEIARLYDLLNTTQKKLNTREEHKAQAEFDEYTQFMDGVLVSAGKYILTEDKKKSFPKGAAKGILEMDSSGDLLRRTIKITQQAWGDNNTGINSAIYGGFAVFDKIYHGRVNALLSKLSTTKPGSKIDGVAVDFSTPAGLYKFAAGRYMGAQPGLNYKDGVYKTLVDIYNHGKSTNRIEWDEAVIAYKKFQQDITARRKAESKETRSERKEALKKLIEDSSLNDD